MPEPSAATADSDFSSKEKSTESLSQFIARVLGQLSLSAWLPSGVLVLGLAVIVELGAGVTSADDPLSTLVGAVKQVARIGLGGAVALLLAITISTVITQAFALEAIRFLEGYWGTSAPAELFAGLRRARFAKKRSRLDRRFDEVTRQAWLTAREALELDQKALLSRKETRKAAIYTPNVVAVVQARATGQERPPLKLSDAEAEAAAALDWRAWADPELLRRRTSLDKKRRDFPRPRRAMPTRLGGVLRAHEDATERVNMESFIQREFDRLPHSLQREHDDQRTRLDVYGTLVFVCGTLSIAATLKSVPFGWYHAAAAAAVGVAFTTAAYGAAIATARSYGRILNVISDKITELDRKHETLDKL